MATPLNATSTSCAPKPRRPERLATRPKLH
uniref:Uncharacterized protein n=1 Tax=Macrostomum lignano TaxID=282301 RepID=A0A1I8F187_9PLAT